MPLTAKLYHSFKGMPKSELVAKLPYHQSTEGREGGSVGMFINTNELAVPSKCFHCQPICVLVRFDSLSSENHRLTHNKTIPPYTPFVNAFHYFSPQSTVRVPPVGLEPTTQPCVKRLLYPLSYGGTITLYHLLFADLYTLPDGRYLITRNTMQSLCLDNNEREETMNSHFANMANSDIVQSSKICGTEEKTCGSLF